MKTVLITGGSGGIEKNCVIFLQIKNFFTYFKNKKSEYNYQNIKKNGV